MIFMLCHQAAKPSGTSGNLYGEPHLKLVVAVSGAVLLTVIFNAAIPRIDGTHNHIVKIFAALVPVRLRFEVDVARKKPAQDPVVVNCLQPSPIGE